jgi:hypothetical protein
MSTTGRVFLTLATLAGLTIYGSSAASAQGVEFFAVLSGGNEVSDAGQAAVGDRNGSGTASVIFSGAAGQICFAILVANIDRPIAAHIHENVAGKNGPIVVPLTAPTTGNPGTSSGCVSGISAALLGRIRSNPTGFYVNVHTTAFSGGAVRGQLF